MSCFWLRVLFIPEGNTTNYKMDEEYDCIILGTGLSECVISGMYFTVEIPYYAEMLYCFYIPPPLIAKNEFNNEENMIF